MQCEKGGVGSLLQNQEDVVGASLDVFQPPSKEMGMRRGREIVVRATNMQN